MSSNTNMDTYGYTGKSIDGPAYDAFVITPSNSDYLPYATRGIYVGGSGNVYCRPYGAEPGVSANVLFHGVVAGTILPIRAEAVWSSNTDNNTQNTTAYSLVGLY